MNKILVFIAVLTMVVVAGGWQPGKTAASADEAIKARCEAFAAAWNKNDTAALAALWSADGDLINPFGRIAKGRAAVEMLFKDEHAVTFKGSHFTQKVASIRTLADGSVAVVDWDVTVTGAHGGDGSALPPANYHCAVVMQKAKDGAWMFEAGRPYVFLTPPAPSAKPPTK